MLYTAAKDLNNTLLSSNSFPFSLYFPFSFPFPHRFLDVADVYVTFLDGNDIDVNDH